MNNKTELETLDRMYNAGKITAEERDKLIAALDAADDTDEEIEAQHREDMKSLEGLSAGLKTLGEKLKELNGLNELEGLKELKNLFEKATPIFASDGDEDEDDEYDDEDDGDIELEQGKSVIVKRRNEQFGLPYSKLRISVKYVSGSTVLKLSESGEDWQSALRQCEECMDEECYARVAELLKSEFTGVYKYVKGATVLKLCVSPDEDD